MPTRLASFVVTSIGCLANVLVSVANWQGHFLADKQRSEIPELTQADLTTLQVLLAVVTTAEPETSPLFEAGQKPVLIYSDASF